MLRSAIDDRVIFAAIAEQGTTYSAQMKSWRSVRDWSSFVRFLRERGTKTFSTGNLSSNTAGIDSKLPITHTSQTRMPPLTKLRLAHGLAATAPLLQPPSYNNVTPSSCAACASNVTILDTPRWVPTWRIMRSAKS